MFKTTWTYGQKSFLVFGISTLKSIEFMAFNSCFISGYLGKTQFLKLLKIGYDISHEFLFVETSIFSCLKTNSSLWQPYVFITIKVFHYMNEYVHYNGETKKRGHFTIIFHLLSTTQLYPTM